MTGTADGRDSLLRRLVALRAQTQGRLTSLERDLAGIVDASRDDNADDEHDPVGATIAFEREQVSALAQQARRRLEELDDAAARVAAGTYGWCEVCGEWIGDDRLLAVPGARRCRDCAAR